ncbi:MAG: molybdopterin-dependent oxidoreductase [Anaerolineales bacterium]|jgi:DMSO/TMAO reductase YedYZ molybdopterin-dependent catalytic subunit
MESTRGTPSISLGASLAGLLVLPWLALTFLGNQLLGLPFPPFVLFDWITRTLPGGLITFGIDSIVAVVDGLGIGPISETTKTVERIIALVIFFGILTIIGTWIAFRARKQDRVKSNTALLWILGLSVVMLLLNASLGFEPVGFLASAFWYLMLFAAWFLMLFWLFQLAPSALSEEPDAPMSRREFIYLVGGGIVTIGVGSLAITRLMNGSDTGGESSNIIQLSDLDQTSGQAASPSTDELQNRIEPVPGTRAEITQQGKFYNVDINALPPSVDGESWRLTFDGLVNNPTEYSLDDLRSKRSVSQAITLSCISNPIGGDLISTAVWTGVPLKDILEEVRPQDQAVEIRMQAEDGFYESISLEDAMDPRTLLVYEMNGEPLPQEHGYPLRIYIPDRYGMKQPKWIVRMEAIDREGDGYWVDRGWSEEAYVRTTSVLDSAATGSSDGGVIPIGGIAYAGAKGISKLEVQIDDGSWQEAQLRIPALSPLTWVQWRFNWPSEPGRHTARVRAYDGAGQLQIVGQNGARPDGATGIHELTFTV